MNPRKLPIYLILEMHELFHLMVHELPELNGPGGGDVLPGRPQLLARYQQHRQTLQDSLLIKRETSNFFLL